MSSTREIECVNFLSSHPDLSVVEVVDKSALEQFRELYKVACEKSDERDALRATNEKLLKHLERMMDRYCADEEIDNKDDAEARALIASAGGAQ